MYTVFVSIIGRCKMPARTIVLKLNQQQLELVDRTIAKGAAADRQSLVKLAVREYAERRAR
jgi:metal-responsive CopG/Arc/MetJ family transcriptional regulator